MNNSQYKKRHSDCAECECCETVSYELPNSGKLKIARYCKHPENRKRKREGDPWREIKNVWSIPPWCPLDDYTGRGKDVN
jgi:hypothetical protein